MNMPDSNYRGAIAGTVRRGNEETTSEIALTISDDVVVVTVTDSGNGSEAVIELTPERINESLGAAIPGAIAAALAERAAGRGRLPLEEPEGE